MKEIGTIYQANDLRTLYITYDGEVYRVNSAALNQMFTREAEFGCHLKDVECKMGVILPDR